jgi:large subunit ribosomal protein L31e
MADKSTELERIYTIPLRRAKHGTRSKRANRAVDDVRIFLTRHMKSENIWIAGEVNESIWSRGKFTIPSKIRVRATRFDDGVVEVTLPDTSTDGSVREAIQERLEAAAVTPVLAPVGMDDEGDHTHAEVAVTEVEGIGPATAEKLEGLEIETAGDLAHADPAAVMEATGKDEETVKGWIEAAHELSHATAHGDSEEE